MRLGKRPTLALCCALVALSLLARFPVSPHELGYDGFIFHGMTLSLVDRGTAGWILSPLSYFGLYPLSQPSGSIFSLASISLLAGMPIEGAVLILDWGAMVLGTLAIFMLSMEIRRDEVLALLVAAFFSLSPRYVTGLMWEIPTRTFFTTLIPLLLFLLLRWHRTRDGRWILPLAVVLLVMTSFHRLTVLVSVVLIAFVATAILVVVTRTLRIQYASRLLTPRFRRAQGVLTLTTFFALALTLLFASDVLANYSAGQVRLGTGLGSELANLGVSIARSTGFLVVLVPFGVLAVYQLRGKEFKEPFLLMMLLFLIPTLSLRQYTGYYIIPVTALFIGLAVWWTAAKARRKSVRAAIVVVALGITLISSALVTSYDLQFSPFLRNTSYVDGVYVRQNTQGTVVSNDGVLASEVFLVSGHACMPVGGATTAFQSPELLMFGFVNRSDLHIVPIPLSGLTLESDSVFNLEGVQAELDWAVLLNSRRASVPTRIWDTYRPAYLLEDTTLGGKYEAYGNLYDSPFIMSIHEGTYAVLELGGQSLWYIGGPG